MEELYRHEKWYRIFGIVMASALIVLTYSVYTSAKELKNYICSETEDSIYATLIEKGYTPAGACGILGNMSVENPKFVADLYSPGGYAYGLFQWMDERITNLKKWCNNRILYWNRTEGQIAFAIAELEGYDSIAHKINSFLKNTDDPAMAAMEFCAGFERCVGSTGNDDRDGIYTGEIYPTLYGRTYQGLNLRVANAKKYYDKYVSPYASTAEELDALLEEAKEDKVFEEMKLDTQGIPTAGIIAEREEAMEDQLIERLNLGEVPEDMNLWGFRLLAITIGYLFGCILGASVLAKATHSKAFQVGEKLPTLKNVLVYLGVKPLIFATLIDVGKFFAALYVTFLMTGGMLRSSQILWVGMGVILGNAYPFWRKFVGGLGITVTIVFICTYMPIWGYISVLIGIIIALLLKSFRIGMISISVVAVPYAFFCKGIEAGVVIAFAMLILIIRHHKYLKKYIDKNLLHRHRAGRHGGKRVQAAQNGIVKTHI